jgi:DNA-directed RNA polymerase I subunit RPA1
LDVSLVFLTAIFQIPPVFAKKLTFPEPVTDHNAKHLRDMVIKGSEEWPGANYVQMENGSLHNLVRQQARHAKNFN